MDQIYKSLSLFITKSTKNDVQEFKTFLQDEFVNDKEKNMLLDDRQKNILKYLSSKESNIGFFDMPSKTGQLDSMNVDEIK